MYSILCPVHPCIFITRLIMAELYHPGSILSDQRPIRDVYRFPIRYARNAPNVTARTSVQTPADHVAASLDPPDVDPPPELPVRTRLSSS